MLCHSNSTITSTGVKATYNKLKHNQPWVHINQVKMHKTF